MRFVIFDVFNGFNMLHALSQDCLSKHGVALMIVNISPTHASTQESACSFRFANQVGKEDHGGAE